MTKMLPVYHDQDATGLPRSESLERRYFPRPHQDTRCESLEDTLRVIRGTEEYIRDAQRLAGGLM